MLKQKRYLLLSILLVALLLCLSSCNEGEDEKNTEPPLFSVTFDSQGGTAVPAQYVASGNLAVEPEIPVREGYVFDCWRKADTGILWSFSSDKVEGDVALRAVWLDAGEIFEVQQIGESETARITGLKHKEKKEYRLPTVVKGFTVVEIGEGAFAELDSEYVARIFLPETVTSVGARAFADCDGIEIKINGRLRMIGEQAFKNCDGLRAVSFDEGLTEVGAEAFWGCRSLVEARLPRSLQIIGENAFQDCAALSVLLLSDQVTTVGDGAFQGCHALRVIYFLGDEDSLELLLATAASMNDPLVDCEKCYLYSATEPQRDTMFEGYWYLDEHNNFRLWKTE